MVVTLSGDYLSYLTHKYEIKRVLRIITTRFKCNGPPDYRFVATFVYYDLVRDPPLQLNLLSLVK